MTPHDFIARWQVADLSERAACQSHFADLCALLGQPKPSDVDPTGSWYAFEKGVDTGDGKKGWADVWMKEKFGWEYKRKHRDLRAAYQQLQRYREALENPPLLVVCDLNRFEVHTNFTGFATKTYAFDLEGLKDPRNVQVLRHTFTDPDKLRPDQSQAAVTEEIANRFAELADGLRKRGEKPDRAAHFLMKLMFCMFAEDIDLLPRGLFTGTVASARTEPARLTKRLKTLFRAMADGGDFGAEEVYHFNGGLFADDDAIDLSAIEIGALHQAALCDWSNVEPSIFGTLFERMLDPGKRSQLGAHYTSRTDIETLLRPVLAAPLRREWDAVRATADKLFEQVRAKATAKAAGKKKGNPRTEHDKLLEGFHDRLKKVTVLDPACGSGNFLYVALHMLLDLEKEVRRYAADHDTTLPQAVLPTQLRGLEVNEYARQLAQEVIWIGFLQWIENNGEVYHPDPILDPLKNIKLMDAILDLSDPSNPKEPEWPAAEFIVGNPPFLGDKKMRAELGDQYVDAVRELYEGRLPGQSDLCCYWFEKARAMISEGSAKRTGLLATQGVRGGANRTCLDRIKESGDIFFAVSDRDWILEGATVHVSMVGFDGGGEEQRLLDGQPVKVINADLTATTDLTKIRVIPDNGDTSFIGASMHGPFEIDENFAKQLLNEPNVHGRPNSDVIRTWANALSITKREPDLWIVDVPPDVSEQAASLYQGPFEYLKSDVFPVRQKNRRPMRKKNWWILGDPQKSMRAAIDCLPRYLLTPRVSKHRVFIWVSLPLLPTDATVAFARDDDFFFGVIHSSTHELWARSIGTQLREAESGFRYGPSTCFETFPFPDPTPAQREAIAAAAKELDTLRTNWLNPPEWTRTEVLEFPGSTDGPWKRYVHDPNAKGIGTVRYPRVVPKDADSAAKLKKRTLTNLYNERPAWLANAHRRLDEAVFAAYGWPADLTDDDLLARLLALNLERAAR